MERQGSVGVGGPDVGPGLEQVLGGRLALPLQRSEEGGALLGRSVSPVHLRARASVTGAHNECVRARGSVE